jgi:enoyl-CoA hydratase/carnithine racemase
MIEVDRSHDGQVETWWLSSPETFNAVTFDMWESLRDEARRAALDASLRAVIIRGRGPHFCSGANIRQLGRSLAADSDGTTYRQLNAEAEDALASLPMVTIAALHGNCVGGGVQLALTCDLRVATPDLVVGVTPVKLGIVYPTGAIDRLVRIVGEATARQLLLLGDLHDAEFARRSGLVHDLVPDLDVQLDAWVASLTARSSYAQMLTKIALARRAEGDAGDGRDLEALSLTHGDVDEGVSAFVEKRPPRFSPRTATP